MATPGIAERIEILGVSVHLLESGALRSAIHGFIARGEKRLVLNVNGHGLNLAYRLPWLRGFLNSADFVFSDGVGVLIAARLLGHRIPERIPFTDWDWQLGSEAEAHGYALFLLGSRPGIAERAAARLEAAHPHLRILGTHHGYFDMRPGSRENEEVISKINAARPDILIVCFGMPLQERWLFENWGRIDARVAMVGGAFLDYVSGNSRRPAVWMREHSLEWFGRLLIDPRRLWRRYLIGNSLFLLRVLRQRLGLLRLEPAGPTPDPTGR